MKNSEFEALKMCPLFFSVRDEDLKSIAEENGQIAHFEKNEVVFSESSYRRAIVIILRGKASVTKSGGAGRILMSVLGKGDVFGMAAMFYESEEFLTEIRAAEKLTLMYISKEKLREIFRLYPTIAENYITLLSERIHFLNRKISTYTKPEIIQRVASFIVQYADEESLCATLPYSVTSVALALNTGRASVYRAFETLQSEGIILRRGRDIQILDLPRLKNL